MLNKASFGRINKKNRKSVIIGFDQGRIMKIDLLYFVGCPFWKSGLENLQAALKADQITGNINLILITNDDAAAEEKFLGSPSFRIGGQDLCY